MFEEQARPSACIHTRHSIWRMYRDAADEDYLLARFSARTNLLYQFWWNAQQSVEKYLKAALLLNGVPVSGYGHQIVGMFEEARRFSGDLLPLLHCPPRHVISYGPSLFGRGGFEEIDSFIQRVEQLGTPDNRYRAFSTITHSSDLIKYDEICFLLRRICFPLDMRIEGLGQTAQEVLSQNRTMQLHPKMAFERNVNTRTEKLRYDHFEWCNFAYFFDLAVERGEYPRWGGMINAEPAMAISSKMMDRLDALRWIAEHGFPTRLRKEVLKSISAATLNEQC
jgi:hypothetical protein